MKTEYTKEEVNNLSKEELNAIMSEQGWVIKGGKLIKVSEEEYRKAVEGIKGKEEAFWG